jgi:acyl-CoA synthetase (AMP-forming)/AMP-acid ligase II
MPKTIAITPSWYWPEAIDRVAGIPPYQVTELCVDAHARDNPDKTALLSDAGDVSFAELALKVAGTAAALRAKGVDRAVLSGDLSVETIIRLLAALRSGVQTRILTEGEAPGNITSGFDDAYNLADLEIVSGLDSGVGLIDLRAAALTICGRSAEVNHSQRSLLAASISLLTFLRSDPEKPWLAVLPLGRWEGLVSILAPLFLGVPVVVAKEGSGEALAETIVKFQPGTAVTDLASSVSATREAKRAVKKSRGILDAMVLSTEGLFSPGDRQRVGKSFGTAALTMFGLAETGAIFVSHPQWYLDEAVGIPMTNAHVVPSDPRNGEPIQALWELVESAEVTVKGPALMCGYEGQDSEAQFVDGRFRTGIIASSDANGMIYILPD